MIDGEAVVAVAAVQRGRGADAVAQEALRDLRGLEEVLRGESAVRVRAVPRRLEHLADLEVVVAVATEDRRRRQVVVEDERVASVLSVNREAAIDALVVVHALHHAVEDRLVVGVLAEGPHHRRLRVDGPIRAKHEEDRVGAAVDVELVDVAKLDHAALDVDQRHVRAGR